MVAKHASRRMLPIPSVYDTEGTYKPDIPLYQLGRPLGGDGSVVTQHQEEIKTDMTGINENEEPQSAAALRLFEDYPEPLTRAQRGLLYSHTASLVYRFKKIEKGARIIERGYKSLQSLLSRLESERVQLKASLDTLILQEKTPDLPTTNKDSAEPFSDSKEASLCGKRPKGLLRSAMFANMHSVLSAAKREEQEKRSGVTLEREKIGKITRLKIIEDDLAKQGQYIAPLTEKYEKSSVVLETAKNEVLNALRLFDEMQRMEVAYASRFFLRASGSQENDSKTGGEGGSCVSYDIFFAPATYTDEVQEMIREQVEEVLDEYLAYRRRVDPVLQTLLEEKRSREAKRTDQLLELIGVDKDNMRVEAFSDFSFAPKLATATATMTTKVGSGDGSSLFLKKDFSAAGQISDGENDNDDGDNEIGDELGEKKQRDQILSALAALDDFEELY